MRPAAHPAGTTVEVRDLFYNVHARRKFVRSDATEVGHIQRWVERLALSRPDVAFRLQNGSRTLLDAPALADDEDASSRVDAVLGREFLERALPVRHAAGPVVIEGWIGVPTAARAHPDSQYWFVNGRHVRDRLLMNAVRLGFRDVLYHGRHPAYLLQLTLDPRLVDVNAHPAKTEVRFCEQRLVHDFLFRSLHEALAQTRAGQAPTLKKFPASLTKLFQGLKKLSTSVTELFTVLKKLLTPLKKFFRGVKKFLGSLKNLNTLRKKLT